MQFSKIRQNLSSGGEGLDWSELQSSESKLGAWKEEFGGGHQRVTHLMRGVDYRCVCTIVVLYHGYDTVVLYNTPTPYLV